MKYYLMGAHFRDASYIQDGEMPADLEDLLFRWPRKRVKTARFKTPVFRAPRKKYHAKAVLCNFADWPCWSERMVRLLKSFKGVDIQKIPIHLQAKDDQVFPEAYYLIYNLCIVDGFIDLQRSEYQWADAPNHKFFSRVQKMVLHPELAGGAPIVETPEMGGGDRLFVSEQFMLAIQTEFTKSELLTLDFYDPDDPIQLMKAL